MTKAPIGSMHRRRCVRSLRLRLPDRRLKLAPRRLKALEERIRIALDRFQLNFGGILPEFLSIFDQGSKLGVEIRQFARKRIGAVRSSETHDRGIQALNSLSQGIETLD